MIGEKSELETCRRKALQKTVMNIAHNAGAFTHSGCLLILKLQGFAIEFGSDSCCYDFGKEQVLITPIALVQNKHPAFTQSSFKCCGCERANLKSRNKCRVENRIWRFYRAVCGFDGLGRRIDCKEGLTTERLRNVMPRVFSDLLRSAIRAMVPTN